MAISSILLEWYILLGSLVFLLKQYTKCRFSSPFLCNNIPARSKLNASVCNSDGLDISNNFKWAHHVNVV